MKKRLCMVCKKEKGTKGLSFHRLPKNKELLDLWLKNLGKENCIVSPYSLVCSEHFASECLEPTFKRVNLRKGSIPTRYGKQNHVSAECGSLLSNTLTQPCVSYTKGSDVHGQKESSIINMDAAPSTTVEKLTEPHCSRVESPEVVATSSECITTCQELHEQVQHDHQYTFTPMSCKKKLEDAQKCIHELRNSKRILGEKVKRLQAKVISLKNVITKLKQLNSVSEEALSILSMLEDIPLELFNRTIKNKKNGVSKQQYPAGYSS